MPKLATGGLTIMTWGPPNQYVWKTASLMETATVAILILDREGATI